MRKQSKYWDKIFTQYRESGLTRPVFCKQHDLSYSQFQYQWYKQHHTSRVISESGMKHSESHLFEAISVTTSTVESVPSVNPIELVICLPNQVRCEIRGGMMSSELPSLLRQLVALC